MTIPGQFWAQCARITGQREVRMELAAGANIAALLEKVYARWPGLSAFDKTLMIAVGVEWAMRDQVLNDGASVMLAPPIAGG
jgi:molybdopterin converting factor small subunit